jgi:hypothetical protein
LFSFSFIQEIYSKSNIEDADYFELLKNMQFVEAIFIASPELYSQIQKWRKGTLKDQRKIEKIKFSILKYAARISTRSTPFGLFASCAIGRFSKEINIKLSPIQDHKRITRFDMSFLSSLVSQLLKENEIKEHLKFYPNTSLYKIGDHYRYVEYTLNNNKREYAIEGISHTDYLENLIQFAKGGRTIVDLTKLLSDNEITNSEAKSFVNKLIDNQILVSELELKVTGEDFLSNLILKLPKDNDYKKSLVLLQSSLKKLDVSYNNLIENYADIIEKAKIIIPELNVNCLLQTDSFTALKSNSLSFNAKRELRKACSVLNRLTSRSANSNLEEFKQRFRNRYGDCEMPLNLVLDIDVGIGYGERKESNNFINDFQTQNIKKRYQRIIWTDVDELMFKKLSEALKENRYVITLKDEDINEYPENWNDLPDTFYGMAEIYSGANGNNIFMNSMSGSSATNLLGRFGHGNEELSEYLKEIVKIEEELNKDKILAEIVHLPQSRTGNILQRPALRKYEIPYLGNSSVPENYQIPIEDLLVSVKGDSIVLKSKRLDKEVFPRLGNAHNYSQNSLPMYQFLCELQTDNKRRMLGFRWNTILLSESFLPRVIYGDLIFSKARWNVKVSKICSFIKSDDMVLEVEQWRSELQIPQYVELIEGDNRLLIDLKNKTSIQVLISTIKNKQQIVLEEFLLDNDGVVKCGEEVFCNQFIVSFYNEAKLKKVSNG